jgi:DNA-directed RNA polymerase subunit K/omega
MDSMPKPVLRAIIELSDKMMQPQVLADWDTGKRARAGDWVGMVIRG